MASLFEEMDGTYTLGPGSIYYTYLEKHRQAHCTDLV